MLKSKELRAKAWESLKGKYWMALAVVLVLSLIISIGTSMVSIANNMTEVVNMVDPAEMDSTMKVGAGVVLGAAFIMSVIGFLLSVFVGTPAEIGLCNYFIKNTDSTPSFKDAFSGYKVKYARNAGALLLVAIKSILWTLLFIIPGIIKSFEYQIIPYILADDPEITTKDAFKKAKEMMTGNKWRLFKLDLSFFGWYVLCVLTLGIGTIFLLPYLNAAIAEFYVELKNKI